MTLPSSAFHAGRAQSGLVLQTPRLELIAATLPLIETELAGARQLAAVLGAEVGAWPPPGNDEGTLGWSVNKLREHPECGASMCGM